MPVKQADGLYELPVGESEQYALAKKYGIKIDSFYGDKEDTKEFHSMDVTIDGKAVLGDDDDEVDDAGYDVHAGGKIPGLRCPDCNAQAFKTDQKNVAVCGDYPGWYFFFRRTDLDKSQASKISIKIINGVPTYVDESGQEVNKNE